MKVWQGRSHASDAGLAIAEAVGDWKVTDAEPDVVFAFCSTTQESDVVARELRQRFPRSLIAGCTSTGEQVGGRWSNDSVVVCGLRDDRVRWSGRTLRDLGSVDGARARAVVDELLGDLGVDREAADPRELFCVLLIDGLAGREEDVAGMIAEALEGIPLVGGSAGDDLKFKQTKVFLGDVTSSDAAVLLLGRTTLPFEVIKHQHFTTTPRQVVTTRVDTRSRTVFELDGVPALDGYAAALGLSPDQVDDKVTFMNPVTFTYAGQLYVRSIQRIEPDGSIVFYCAVEEGMVLEIGGHHAIDASLRDELGKVVEQRGKPAFMLTFNCILRALEAKERGVVAELGDVLQQSSAASVGFDTYGEQLNGLHINQTFVALAIHDAPQEA